MPRGDRRDRIAGVILGTAVGDALGLPWEGISRPRAERWRGTGELRHTLLFGHGMVSDDTEHTCLVAQALLEAADDPDRFARALARRMRVWLLGLPPGVGLATLRATGKLCLGYPPHRSGVWSAGNGPAMRVAILGVCLGRDPDRLAAAVRTSTRITHTDPRAERAAGLVARAAHYGATHDPDRVDGPAFLADAQRGPGDRDAEWARLLARLADHLARGTPAADLADALGLAKGVTGYIYHTVPLALYAWLRHPGDFRAAVTEVVRLGGDTDTTGSIVGALVGATTGVSAIPPEWLDGLVEWPCSLRWMHALADRLAEQFPTGERARSPLGPHQSLGPLLVARNLFFLAVVLAHGFRRLLPPY